MGNHTYPGDLRIGVLNEGFVYQRRQTERELGPKQMVMLLLEGHQRFSIDGHEFVLSADESRKPVSMMVRLERRSKLKMLEYRGRPFSKVVVSTEPQWPARTLAGPSISEKTYQTGDVMRGHLVFRFLDPDSAMLQAAHALIAGDSRTDLLGDLDFMSHGISFYRAALGNCLRGQGENDSQARRSSIERVYYHVLSHINDPGLNAETLAQGCALSPRTLQRLCQENFGKSPASFIRSQRMAMAFTALKERSVSVTEAGFIAGYSNPTNFSTAFKREFGFSPRVLLGKTAS